MYMASACRIPDLQILDFICIMTPKIIKNFKILCKLGNKRLYMPSTLAVLSPNPTPYKPNSSSFSLGCQGDMEARQFLFFCVLVYVLIYLASV